MTSLIIEKTGVQLRLLELIETLLAAATTARGTTGAITTGLGIGIATAATTFMAGTVATAAIAGN